MSIETAIARGQGVSLTGSALENLKIEAMILPSIALVIECQTDSKMRTLQDIRETLKYGGATITPTSYLFDRRGKIVFEKTRDLSDEEVLEQAIEAGALDVHVEEDGRIVVLTEPTQTTSIAGVLAASLGLKAESSEFIWDAKVESKVVVDSASIASRIDDLIGMSHRIVTATLSSSTY